MVPTIYTSKSDVYSFGMLCYEILTGLIYTPHRVSGIELRCGFGGNATANDTFGCVPKKVGRAYNSVVWAARSQSPANFIGDRFASATDCGGEREFVSYLDSPYIR